MPRSQTVIINCGSDPIEVAGLLNAFATEHQLFWRVIAKAVFELECSATQWQLFRLSTIQAGVTLPDNGIDKVMALDINPCPSNGQWPLSCKVKISQPGECHLRKYQLIPVGIVNKTKLKECFTKIARAECMRGTFDYQVAVVRSLHGRISPAITVNINFEETDSLDSHIGARITCAGNIHFHLEQFTSEVEPLTLHPPAPELLRETPMQHWERSHNYSALPQLLRLICPTPFIPDDNLARRRIELLQVEEVPEDLTPLEKEVSVPYEGFSLTENGG